MSTTRRSWSKVGDRAITPNQQEFECAYLYSAIDPINGDNFHIRGWQNVSGEHTLAFLNALKKEYQDYHLIIIWDNAPFHKNKILYGNPRLSLFALPPYSPQLNPVERFFCEIRRDTSNRIYTDLDDLEEKIDKIIVHWIMIKCFLCVLMIGF